MAFRVEITIQPGWRIPSDSIARIGSSSFLAAKTIDIDSGMSPVAVALGARIASAPPSDIFATITATAGEISEFNRENLTPLLETLQSLAETVEGDGPRILDELAAFTESLNESIEPLRQILNLEETTGNLAAISRNLTGTMVKVDNLAGNLDALVENNKGNVDQSLKDIQYTLSAVSATVDSIVHNLEGTTRNMNEFSRLIRQNPGLLLDGTPRAAVSPARATLDEDDNKG